jgi:molybdopterin/thiamine biosynthesis adenylyltransferase
LPASAPFLRESWKNPELFSRNAGTFTTEDQAQLRSRTVAVAGLGGVGGPIVEALARMGIGGLRIADPEVFQHCDSNRQVGAAQSTIGMRKADVFAARLRDINPELELAVFPERITAANAAVFVDSADLVVNEIDGCSLDEMIDLFATARERGLTVLQGAVREWSAAIFRFTPQGLAPDFFLKLLLPIYSNDKARVVPTNAPICLTAAAWVASESAASLLGHPSWGAVPEFLKVSLVPPGARIVDFSPVLDLWGAAWYETEVRGEPIAPQMDLIMDEIAALLGEDTS